MEDSKIVEMFWNRNEEALNLLESKYGRDLKGIAFGILNNNEDCEECLNDAYFRTWNSIPPARPKYLFAYVGKITRNISLNYLKRKSAQKRINDEKHVLLSELEECISDKETVVTQSEYKELSQYISQFLYSLKKEQRVMFVERYWYAKKISDISEIHNCTDKKVESVLLRCRRKLKLYLTEKGYY